MRTFSCKKIEKDSMFISALMNEKCTCERSHFFPIVFSVSVDGGLNTPTGSPNSADGEVELDIEVAGSLAPGAKIAVYFAPNIDQGFLDTIVLSASLAILGIM